MARDGRKGDYKEVDRQLGEPIRSLIGRGLAEGVLREDLSEDELIVLFRSLVEAAAHLISNVHVGMERAAAIASSDF